MTEKELHRLRRQDLLQLLLAQSREVARLKEELTALEASRSAAEESNERLKDKLNIKDEQIEHLKDRLNHKDEVIRQMEGLNGEEPESGSAGKSKWQETQFRKLREQAARTDTTLQELCAEMEQWRVAYKAESEELVSELRDSNALLKRTISDQDAELAAMRKKLEGRDAELKGLRKKLGSGGETKKK